MTIMLGKHLGFLLEGFIFGRGGTYNGVCRGTFGLMQEGKYPGPFNGHFGVGLDILYSLLCA